MAKKIKIIRNGGMYGKKTATGKKIICALSLAVIATAAALTGYFFANGLDLKDMYNKISAHNGTDSINKSSDTEDKASNTGSANTNADSQTDGEEIPPLVYDSDAQGMFGDDDKKVYVFDNVAYEIFYGNDFSAQNYAKTVNSLSIKLKNILCENTKFYSMVIPTRSEFTLPDKQKIKSGTFSQKNNMKTVADNLDTDITFVDVYKTLMKHRNEYIFYNTDPVWTARGAYYGYEEFCRVSGNEPIALEKLTENTNKIEGYIGRSGMVASDNSEAYEMIKKNADTVEYYDIPGDYQVTVTDSNGNTQTASLYYPTPSSKYAYAVFLFGGDNPIMNIKTQNNSGKNLLVIKDSSANVMIPYLACNYDEVIIVDYRYIDFSIENIITDKGIDEVLFLNGIMDANTEIRNSSMSELIK